MAKVQTTGLTWRDLDEQFPELERRELHDGVLLATPAPAWWHQRMVVRLCRALSEWTDEHGGEVFVAPADIVAAERRVYQPDVWLLRKEHLDWLGSNGKVHEPPDLVAEVSSPPNRSFDLGQKRDAYAAFGVPEYWFVVGEDGRLDSMLLPGFTLPVGRLFA